ncbi:MAG: NAD-binding protein [Planctomycetes bacterium]|nr:NAD-binding protein [Planctomycetota bacterium]
MFHALQRIFKSLRAKDERAQLAWLLVLVMVVLAYGAIGFHYTEGEDWETSIWWSLVTMTTVGYGDYFPKTFAGRWLVGVPVMVIGIGVLGYALGTLATAVIERRNKEARGMVPFTGENHVLVCHYPGEDLVLEILAEMRADTVWEQHPIVLLTDQLEEMTPALREAGVIFVSGSPSREVALKKANVSKARAVMVLSREPGEPATDNQTLGAVVTIRAISKEVYVVAEAASAENLTLIKNAGANEVVGVATLAAELLVQGIQDPGVNGAIGELLSNTTGHQIYIHPITKHKGTFGDVVGKLTPGRYSAIGLIDKTGNRSFVPTPDTVVEPGQSLMLIGDVRPDPV